MYFFLTLLADTIENAPPVHQEIAPATFSYEHALVKMLITLGVLIVFIFLAVWSLKRLSRAKWMGGGTSRKIQILEKRPLSQKSMLYLISVGGKHILIAESQLEVRALSTVEESLDHET